MKNPQSVPILVGLDWGFTHYIGIGDRTSNEPVLIKDNNLGVVGIEANDY